MLAHVGSEAKCRSKPVLIPTFLFKMQLNGRMIGKATLLKCRPKALTDPEYEKEFKNKPGSSLNLHCHFLHWLETTTGPGPYE